MSSSQPLLNPDALRDLSNAVNETLIGTGRFFRALGSAPAKAHLRRTIPDAHEQFHMALDSLSEQIFIAKALLEKDYEAIRATKVSLLSPEPAVSSSEPSLADDDDAVEEVVLVPELDQRPNENTQLQVNPRQPVASDQMARRNLSKGMTSVLQHNDGKALKREEAADKVDQSFQGVGELNLDSILPATGSGVNDYEINLDFSNDDDLGNQNFLSGTNYAEGVGSKQSKDQDGSINSLLPGIERYAATAGDDFNLELQKVNDEEPPRSENPRHSNQEDIMGPGESNFDDLFMETDNFGGEDDDNMLGDGSLMGMGDLDSFF
ncbi:hypothetical protein V8E54_000343 [Elaphomyces granulatus]